MTLRVSIPDPILFYLSELEAVKGVFSASSGCASLSLSLVLRFFFFYDFFLSLAGNEESSG